MPYIKPSDRSDLQTGKRSAGTAGELNFRITSLCLDYLSAKEASYAVFNEVVGALECAKLELYRRMVVPYEDRKLAENGDVYPAAR